MYWHSHECQFPLKEKTMTVVNYAIVGFGNIARTHAMAAMDWNLRNKDGRTLNLKYIVTRNPDKVFLPGVISTSDIDMVLSGKEIDFVSICTPNENHMEILEKAAHYKIPVYCEKPLATDYETASQMNKLVTEKNLRSAVALIYRQIPALNELRKLVAEGLIGDIISYRIETYHDSYLSPEKATVWRVKKSSGGGALLDLGIHLVDIVNWVFGKPEVSWADTRTFFSERSEVDEIAEVKLKHSKENGSSFTGTLKVSRIFSENDQRDTFEIFGTKGSIIINFKSPQVIMHKDFSSKSTNAIKLEDKYPGFRNQRASLGYAQDCHTNAIAQFAFSLGEASQPSPGADFKDALEAQEIIDQVYKMRG